VRTEAPAEMCMRSLMLMISVLFCDPTATIGAHNQTATVRVQVRASEKPVEDAEVVVAGTTHRTDAAGTTTIVTVPGTVDITVLKSGFASTTVSVQVAVGATQDVVVVLQAQPTVEETVTVVASTRTDKRLEDQPMRVEVLAREEIEEKMLMTPGDIVMMLNEMGGMRVQATSPSLGAASVRIQGMRGRYTRVLRATTTSLVKSSSAIGTTRCSAKRPCVGPRVARHGSWGSPSNGTRTRRAMCLDSITSSPCQAHLRSTTSPRRHTSRSRRALGWTFTASTARSSVLACQRWRTPVAGRAGSRSGPVSSGPRRSPKKLRPPASRVWKSASLLTPSVG
jgi:hypothetical protein